MKPVPPRPKRIIDDGGPAHPCVTGVDGYGSSRPTGQTSPDGRAVFENLSTGLTKREYFAAKAMAGLCANSTNSEVRGLGHFPTFAAEWACRMADSLLDELAKGRQ